jgi:hypothetical protein
MLSVDDVEKIIKRPFEMTRRNCHAVSLAIVRSGKLGEPGKACRVARGFCRGLKGQHSWIVLGPNPYLLGVSIVDATLWSYDNTDPGLWFGRATNEGRHVPHGGVGSIWTYGQPTRGDGPIVELKPKTPWSPAADAFLSMLGPLDRRGWALLAHAPVLGWPASEIISAMYECEALSALVPIDIVGMVTDHNPQELYW